MKKMVMNKTAVVAGFHQNDQVEDRENVTIRERSIKIMRWRCFDKEEGQDHRRNSETFRECWLSVRPPPNQH